MARTDIPTGQRPARILILHGINAGITAGLVLILVQMVMNLAMNKPFFEPLRLVSTIGLGSQAIAPDYSLVISTMAGLIIHLALSAIYGIIFVYLLAYAGQLSTSTERLLVYGSIFGFLLWVINLLIVAPVAALPQFTALNQFWQGFIAYTFFFGTLLGVYGAAAKLDEEATKE